MHLIRHEITEPPTTATRATATRAGARCKVLVIATSLLVFAFSAYGDTLRRGDLTHERVAGGAYWQWVPESHRSPSKVLLISHGSIREGETAEQTARSFLRRWIPVSDWTGLILIAPIFDVESYASGTDAPGGAAWGYRALDGRTTKPDVFVHQIMDRLADADPAFDGRFYLYGHSAGAQFANHYLVIHPERLRGVVLSAPAIYAMPDPETPWPKGMKARERTLRWGDRKTLFQIRPDPATWVRATQVPITVVIGDRDTTRISDQPQQGGWTRVDRAHHYVQEMKRFAAEHGVRPQIHVRSVPGVGHNSKALTLDAKKALVEILRDR